MAAPEPGRSRMRQEKLTGSLRRGGRCLKRQGGGGGSSGGSSGGVGTILSNVLKKRSCISRTAPRLLCTLEPGEDRELQTGRWKVVRRPWSGAAPASASAVLHLGQRARSAAWCWVPRLGGGWGWVSLGGPITDQGLGRGSGLRRHGGLAALPPASGPPTPRPVRGPALLVPGAGEVLVACRGHQRLRNRLCTRLTRSQTLKEMCEAEKGTGLILRI